MQERLWEYSSKIFTALRPLLLLILALAAIVNSYLLKISYRPKPSNPLVKIVAGKAEEKPEDKSEVIKVSITGAVNKPGVYEFSDDSAIIQDLLNKAGGVNKNADLAYLSRQINLAKLLENGEQIYIPSLKEQKLIEIVIGQDSSSTGDQSTDKVNLNSATQEQLETLPGIGPSTAQKIIAARPYQTIEDIKNVSGIGEATYEKLKNLISV